MPPSNVLCLRGFASQVFTMLADVNVSKMGRGAAVVELCREHDLSTKDKLSALLASLVEQHELVVIDVSEADFIDSSVLNNLAQADKLAKQHGSHVRLQLGTAKIVRTALEISGLLAVLDCASDRQEALKPPDPPSTPHRRLR